MPAKTNYLLLAAALLSLTLTGASAHAADVYAASPQPAAGIANDGASGDGSLASLVFPTAAAPSAEATPDADAVLDPRLASDRPAWLERPLLLADHSGANAASDSSAVAAQPASVAGTETTVVKTPAPEPRRRSASDAMFPQGSQSFSLQMSYAEPFGTGGNDHEFGGQDERFLALSQSYGYALFDNFIITPKITEHYVISDVHDSVGADFRLSLRWHFLQFGDWTLFAQGGGGAGYFTRRVPEGTTNFDFVSELGPGFTYKLEENMHLIGGADWQHFSNAEIAGAQRHGSSNTVQFYVGLLWTF